MDHFIDGLSFPEAPRWHAGKFWFSDFYTHKVHCADDAGNLVTVAEVQGRPSGLGIRADGTILIVSMLERKLLQLVDGTLSVFADLRKYAAGPCNDMFVTDTGCAYVGNFGYNLHQGELPRATRLIRVDTDGSVSPTGDDLIFPNGMAVTPDDQSLMVAETFAGRISAFQFGDGGSLINRRTFAALENFAPDGICLDKEGGLWVADIRGRRLLRLLEGGQIDRTVPTGDRIPFACMLGGNDRRTLFVCTNTGSGPAMAEKREGRIDTLRVDVPGVVI